MLARWQLGLQALGLKHPCCIVLVPPLDCRCVSSVHHFCWNNHYNSTKPDGVPGIVTIGLNPSISCPKTPAELQQFTHDLEIISDKLKEASGGIIDSIAWERYTPILCTQVSVGDVFVLERWSWLRQSRSLPLPGGLQVPCLMVV